MGDETHEDPLLAAGRNCWLVERAERVGLLVGGEAYFRAVRRALLAAESHAFILAWDIHSEVRLVRGEDEPADGLPAEVGPFFRALLESKPALHLHLLVWDFSMIYAAEREWPVFSDLLRNPHPRFHLKYDDELPLGSSHHQKAVVIDDSLALLSGLDLSVWRWDTEARRLHDPRRVDPEGKPYNPYHDAGVAVTGPAARALGDLCAARWKRATGRALRRRDAPRSPVPWPEGVEVDFEEIEVGIARTYATHEPWPAVREIERFHLDLIAAARDYLYFENQYFSSHRLARALADRLRETDGPEVIIVITRDAGGRLEESTMGLLRNRLLEILRDADAHDRLKVYSPRVTDESGEDVADVYVHAKLVFADDRIFKLGSSNLSNRSMRVDSEADLIIERPTADRVVRRWFHRFLGAHFGMDAGEIAARREEAAGIGALIESLITDRRHSLRSFLFGCDSDWERRLADSQLLDPDEPVDPEYWLRRFVPADERRSVVRRVTQLSAILLVGLGLAFLMKTGWGNFIDRDAVVGFVELVESHPLAPLILVALFLVAGVTGVPINLIVVGATLAAGPWRALGCGVLGAHLAALAGYGLGHHFGKGLLKRWASESVRRLDRRLGERGVWPVALVRVLPVAPFVVVNVVAGASQLKLRDFNLGTLWGMAPGMAGVVLLTHRLNVAVADPGWGNVLIFALVLALVVGAVVFVRRALARRPVDDVSP